MWENENFHAHLDRQLKHLERKIMSLFDDLKTAVTDLQDKAAANHAAVLAELDALKAAIAAGAPPADLQAIVDNVKNISTTIAGDTAALSASLPAPAAPPTPPTPPTPPAA